MIVIAADSDSLNRKGLDSVECFQIDRIQLHNLDVEVHLILHLSRKNKMESNLFLFEELVVALAWRRMTFLAVDLEVASKVESQVFMNVE